MDYNKKIDELLLAACETMLRNVEDKTSFEAEVWKDAIRWYKKIIAGY